MHVLITFLWCKMSKYIQGEGLNNVKFIQGIDEMLSYISTEYVFKRQQLREKL